MDTTRAAEASEPLESAISNFWHEYVGLRPARVRMVSDGKAVAIWLEEVLAPAELQLAKTRQGRETLREWGRCITEAAVPDLCEIVTGRLGRRIRTAEAHLDVASHTLHLFFDLDQT